MEADGIHHFPYEGIEIWKNPKNKFVIFQCKYTADLAKRSDEFREVTKSSLPLRKFLMEYEIHWESFSGLPIFGDTWNKKIHMSEKMIKPELGLPLLCGVDFGLTPALVIAQVWGTRLMVMKEFVSVNMGMERFLAKVIPELKQLYPFWTDLAKDYLMFIDPSGAFRKDTDESTCVTVMQDKGFRNIIPGALSFEERRQSVEYFLTRMEGGDPCFQISGAECPILVKGFEGGYHFKEGQDEIESRKLEALKNAYSHPMDALAYLCSRIMKISRAGKANIPTPNYSWSRSNRSA